jgi:hypothetical protein
VGTQKTTIEKLKNSPKLLPAYGRKKLWEILNTEETIDQEIAVLEVTDREKCMMLFVMNVKRNVKCHSNLQKASQFIVKNVSLKGIKDKNLRKTVIF